MKNREELIKIVDECKNLQSYGERLNAQAQEIKDETIQSKLRDGISAVENGRKQLTKYLESMPKPESKEPKATKEFSWDDKPFQDPKWSKPALSGDHWNQPILGKKPTGDDKIDSDKLVGEVEYFFDLAKDFVRNVERLVADNE